MRRCLVGLASLALFPAPATGARLRALRWLHFPKAGQSLRTALVRSGCEGVMANATFGSTGDSELRVRCCPGGCARVACDGLDLRTFFAHKALQRGETASKRVVAMFREPSRRIASAFFDGKHAYGLETPGIEAVASPADFARFPGIAGCATKMLLGRKCAANATTATNTSTGAPLLDVDEAKRRLGQLAFVGLTDEWEQSLRLWHATFGGGKPSASELENTHLGRFRGARYDDALLGGFRDVADAALYAEAKRLFEARLDAFGLSKRPPSPAAPGDAASSARPPAKRDRKRCYCTQKAPACRPGAFRGPPPPR